MHNPVFRNINGYQFVIRLRIMQVVEVCSSFSTKGALGMDIPKFSEDELKVVDELPEMPWRPVIKIFDYPVTAREAMLSVYKDKKALWQIIGVENQLFNPWIYPDNIARAWVMEAQPFDALKDGGGLDVFGVKWVYVPVAMGSMEDPNEEPWMDDANDWKEYVHFPDLDSWDWEASAAANNDIYLKPDVVNTMWIQNGFFERLISFMGFEDASVAMIDEDQEDAVKEFMRAMADFYIDLIDHFVKYYKYIDGFYIHDDWGSSKDTFVAPDRIAEIVVPAMRRVTDHIHGLGMYAELHSCGCNYKQVQNMIDAGWDVWIPQAAVNDVEKIYNEFGDQIIIGVPVQFDPEKTTEEEQRQAARDYAKKFCKPDKPSIFSGIDCCTCLTPAFREELYIASRKAYSGEAVD